ncbi:MAG TPA: hypothetical protein VD963_06650, partial [Phycisphaerales bacterium]|nr:hypothetical protein [Phycisphaerales bacterium]
WVVLGAGLRAADVLVQAARMVVASHLAGRAISPEQALLAGSTYVLIGALAPTGMLGVREAGAAGAGALAGETDLRLVVLLVTASEVLVALAAGAAAWVCLRPGRWLPRRRVTAP